jgi:hypothetical protein
MSCPRAAFGTRWRVDRGAACSVPSVEHVQAGQSHPDLMDRLSAALAGRHVIFTDRRDAILRNGLECCLTAKCRNRRSRGALPRYFTRSVHRRDLSAPKEISGRWSSTRRRSVRYTPKSMTRAYASKATYLDIHSRLFKYDSRSWIWSGLSWNSGMVG